MKEITFSLAHYQAIQNEQGAAAAVEAIRSEIQGHVTFPIDLELRGPNPDGDRVASLSFVRAASWKSEHKGFKVNLLTCGFAPSDDMSVANLFTALTNPQVPVVIHSELLAEDEEDPHEEAKEFIGLIVGSHSHPSAFIKFEP